jgi:flagellar hook-associated protein 3 FlgL
MSGLATIYDITSLALQRHAALLSRLQEQTATGSRVIRASDAPGDAYAIMDLRDQVSSIGTYQKNIDSVSQELDLSANVLQEISSTMTRITQVVTQAANGSYNQQNRKATAQEIDSDLEHMLSLVNTKSLNRYLFSGASTSQAPYDVQRVNGSIQSVTYVGSQQESRVPVAPGVEQTGALVGERVFSSGRRQVPTFGGSTGLKAGDGTSTVAGDVWLTVSHDTTTYLGATGVAAGASTGMDTIVGSHQLVIDADGKKIKLDDGPLVDFDASSTNLKLQNAKGETVYVDMSALDGSLTGTVTANITATARGSVDDGATSTVLNGSTNQAITDSRTGKILYVNSSGLGQLGVEPVRVAGTYDLFNALIQVRDVLLNNRNLSSGDQSDLLNHSLDSIAEVTAGVNEMVTSVGGRQQALDGLKKSMDSMSAVAGDQAAQLQDADVATLAIELSRTQTFYQMTLASTSKLLSLSLLDYMK